MQSSLQSCFLSLLLARIVAAACECGYRTNTGQVWQFSIVTDFTTSTNASKTLTSDWQVVQRVLGDITESTPHQTNYTAANVVIPTRNSTTKDLILVASAYTGGANGAVASGQISTLRDDIYFGSFRAQYSVNGGAGACAGFFSYANDTNENDIEVLTKNGNDEVVFTNQGLDTSNSSVTQTLPNGALTTSTQLYRFDWTKDSVKYYVNNYFMTDITSNPSQLASRIFMNAWSNGNTFTGGPPTSDMNLSVSSINLYFNSSDSSSIAQYTSACSTAGTDAICNVDSQDIIYQSTATSSASRATNANAIASVTRSATSLSIRISLTASSALVVVLATLFIASSSC